VKRAHSRITSALRESAADLLAYFQRRVGHEEAPDLLGETMVVAWRRVDDLPNDPEQARMWLFGIARNTLLNHARGERRRWALVDRIRGNSATEIVAPAADHGAEIRDAIARLDIDHRELVQLVHWERMTITQAAELLGISDSTARTRYARAKEELRTALKVPMDSHR
jgi:RNA polymerase sigma-70 factor (ECF subfamily)